MERPGYLGDDGGGGLDGLICNCCCKCDCECGCATCTCACEEGELFPRDVPQWMGSASNLNDILYAVPWSLAIIAAIMV